MAKKKDIILSDFPEEITEDGLKIYGSASYETQIAILSHYLHTLDGKHDIASGEKRYEILGAIHDYIEYKKQKDKSKDWQEVDEEELFQVMDGQTYVPQHRERIIDSKFLNVA